MTIELGLQRISKLLAKQVEPAKWRAVHVAGTNGKGTVCSLVSEMLNAYNQSRYCERRGHRGRVSHGRFTSPHLVDRWDCITRNNAESTKMIPIDGEYFQKIEQSYRKRDKRYNIGASNFEILTATAFEAFKELDIGVVEVGLGGRLDATNVLGQSFPVKDRSQSGQSSQHIFPPPLITTITRIGLDHQEFLGPTIRDIAREKAGIMRCGVPATWLPAHNDYDVNSELERHANAVGAQIVRPDECVVTHRIAKPSGIDSSKVSNGRLAMTSTLVALQGLNRIDPSCLHGESKHQGEFDALVRQWQSIIRDYVFPGRQEWVSLEPINGWKAEVLLDGAHNTQGIAALSETVNSTCRRKVGRAGKPELSPPISWVIAISDSKDRNTVDILKPLLAEGDTVHAVEFGPVDGMPWVKPKSSLEVAKAARNLIPGLNADDGRTLQEALTAASDRARDIGGNVVVCGSLYLIGDVHRLLREKQRASGMETGPQWWERWTGRHAPCSYQASMP